MHPDLVFNNSPVHLHDSLPETFRSIFRHEIKFSTTYQGKNLKAMTGICIIKKLSNVLRKKSLITIYKSFVRPHLDYGDLIYD